MKRLQEGPDRRREGEGGSEGKGHPDKIITYFSEQIRKRIPLKALPDTGEMLYYEDQKKVYRLGGERVIDVEIEKIESF